jgi:hypothetical protein
MNPLRRALMDGDVKAAVAAWRSIAPHLPPPPSDEAATASMHMARTATQTIPPRLRYYSHRWLTDHGYPSQLPDRLRAPAERMYPRKEDVVGISTTTKIPVVREALVGAMSYAVEDCYANGDRDPLIVKPQMMAARARERRGLML